MRGLPNGVSGKGRRSCVSLAFNLNESKERTAMKHTTSLSLLAAAALALSLPAIAQQPAPAPAPAPATPPAATAPAPAAPAAKVAIPRGVFVANQASNQYLARDRLIGAKVHNKDGIIIGDIEDLIVGPGNQIVGVVVGTGGFLGVGEKRIGVQLGALVIGQRDGKQYVSLPQATKDVLGALPAYKRLEPKKSLTERAIEKTKEISDRSKDTFKDKAGPLMDKAKEAVKPAEPAKPAEKK